MTNVHASTRPSEQGFTLVELAIVMVIIGLLIGGILKGQELIANAKISGTVGQLKGLDAAMNTFDDKYNAKPGLMTDALNRLPGCVAPCANVVGQTTYGASLAPPAAIDNPGAQVFLHLSAADLISGIDPSGATPLTFGKALPAVKAGGGMWVGTAAAAGEVTNGTLSVGRPYAVLNGQVAAVAAGTGVLASTTAAQIDRKLDDGQPSSGSVQTSGANCVTVGAPNVYNEAATNSTCHVASRVLN